MDKKNFKTLEEQIILLENKGLIINDKEYAKEILLRENYFFLNGYRHVFYTSDYNRKFIRGTTFDMFKDKYIVASIGKIHDKLLSKLDI